MRTLLIACAFVIAVSGPALACRGTAEYPEAAGQIAQSKLTPERKKELMELLSRGDAMHAEAHRQGDMTKMGESIRILDGIGAQIGE